MKILDTCEILDSNFNTATTAKQLNLCEFASLSARRCERKFILLFACCLKRADFCVCTKLLTQRASTLSRLMLECLNWQGLKTGANDKIS